MREEINQLKNLIEKMNTKSSEEFEKIISFGNDLIQKFERKAKLQHFTTEMKKFKSLEHLFIEDKDCYFKKSHLEKCVLLTKKYIFMEEYIDLYLTENPETVNCWNSLNFTALSLAVQNFNTSSTIETIEILLKHGADVNISVHTLMDAIRTDDIKIIKLLLDHGAKIYLCAIEYVLNISVDNENREIFLNLLIDKMENCDIDIYHEKLISKMYKNKFSNDLIMKAIQKGAKITDIDCYRFYDLMNRYNAL